jgi:hypothetical protein
MCSSLLAEIFVLYLQVTEWSLSNRVGSVHRAIIHIEEYPGPILHFLPAIDWQNYRPC